MDTKIIVDGLCFGEGPRWREGFLWFSDMHALRRCFEHFAGMHVGKPEKPVAPARPLTKTQSVDNDFGVHNRLLPHLPTVNDKYLARYKTGAV